VLLSILTETVHLSGTHVITARSQILGRLLLESDMVSSLFARRMMYCMMSSVISTTDLYNAHFSLLHVSYTAVSVVSCFLGPDRG
jgi:hypothetical protein